MAINDLMFLDSRLHFATSNFGVVQSILLNLTEGILELSSYHSKFKLQFRVKNSLFTCIFTFHLVECSSQKPLHLGFCEVPAYHIAKIKTTKE